MYQPLRSSHFAAGTNPQLKFMICLIFNAGTLRFSVSILYRTIQDFWDQIPLFPLQLAKKFPKLTFSSPNPKSVQIKAWTYFSSLDLFFIYNKF